MGSCCMPLPLGRPLSLGIAVARVANVLLVVEYAVTRVSHATISDSETHDHAVAGNYTVVLMVADDDGGVREIPILIALLP